MTGHFCFKFLDAFSFGRALCSYSPFDWLAKKLHFQEKLVKSLGFSMVTLPTRAYVGGAFAAVESYGKFWYGF